MTAEEYVAREGEYCPNCGIAKVTVMEMFSNGPASILQNCLCRNCGSEWTENYALMGYSDLIAPNHDKGLRVVP